MAIYNCKMCGGTIEFEQGDTVGVCDCCGTKQTLPRLDGKQRESLYERANHFRRNNDFDKAAGIYEQILNEDTTDAEAYWSLVLCQYGIDYVEDPATEKRVPTVNRAQFTSVFDDDNYKSALKYADTLQRSIYEEEAHAINEIQKGILAISQKEEPFDVFICYKETDENGRRTQDSVLASDLYHQLTQEGFKVFFSRITLEDKLGTAYEPYIFAALNSAKVMVVLGTRQEYFNAVWVKNEWSRFLGLVKKSGGKKVLIPAYKDMDPYNLPEEFSHLQAQDMNKLGFMQDLIRGIKKIVKSDEPKKTEKNTSVGSDNTTVSPLLKRAFIFLEDGKWKDADVYCEKVLDQDPENAQAYLGKLMAEMQVRRQEDLSECKTSFESSSNYQKVARYGNENLVSTLKEYITLINGRNASSQLLSPVDVAGSVSANISDRNVEDSKNTKEKSNGKGKKVAVIIAAAVLVCAVAAVALIVVLLPKMKYNKAINLLKSKDYESAYAILRELGKEDEITNNKEERASSCLISGDYETAYALLKEIGKTDAITESKYNRAWEYLYSGDYDTAYSLLSQIGKDDLIISSKKERADSLIASGLYDSAYSLLEEVGDYRTINQNKYTRALVMIEEGNFDKAYSLLEESGNSETVAENKYERAIALKDAGDKEGARELLKGINYKDSVSILNTMKLDEQKEAMRTATIGSYVFFGSYEQDNDSTNGKEDIEWMVVERKGNKVLLLSRYALDCQPFNQTDVGITWETCTLRKWLNETFFDNAFNDEEKAVVIHSDVEAQMNYVFGTSAGNDTIDQVFLLCRENLIYTSYFNRFMNGMDPYEPVSHDYLLCQGTKYCFSKGAKKNESGMCIWWLRTPGDVQNSAIAVNENGYIHEDGFFAYITDVAVRPAIWVNYGP